MGVSMRCLDPAEDAPAAVAARHDVGHFRDAEAISKFASTVDVLTVEIEHIDADALERAAAASGVDVEPTPNTIRIIQVWGGCAGGGCGARGSEAVWRIWGSCGGLGRTCSGSRWIEWL
jgi:hypothetical protein